MENNLSKLKNKHIELTGIGHAVPVQEQGALDKEGSQPMARKPQFGKISSPAPPSHNQMSKYIQ
jgi:hypothetical protein